MRQAVVIPGKTPRQLLRLDLARARRVVRSIRGDLRERVEFFGGRKNLPAWELDAWAERERWANKDAAKLRARLDKMG